MPNVPQIERAPSDARESETVRVPHVPSQTLIRVARIEAHAERATATLMATEDADTLSDVFADLSAIRSICNAVLR